MKKLKTDVLIIGAGPAGMAMALYLKRAKVNCLLVEKTAPGGKLNNIAFINNYLGIKSITGPDLAVNMYQQIADIGVDIINEEVLRLSSGFLAYTSESEITAKIVVLAIGVTMTKLLVPGYDKYFGHGVSTCAVCDGFLYRNKKIVVIGNNDIANKEYNYLKSLSNNVRRIDGVNEKVISFIGDKKLTSITTTKKRYIVDAAFVYSKENINHILIDSLNVACRHNHIVVDANFETNVHNCFAIGDAIEKKIYQIVGAINDASIASLAIIKRLK